MGFESVIATGISLMVLMIVSYALFSGFTTSMDGMTSTLKDVMNIKNDQLKTDITAEYEYAVVDNNTITMKLHNVGNTKIVNISQIEMIMTFSRTTNNTTETTYWIPYSSDNGTTDPSWKLINITPDMINPRVWDPGETMTVEITLPDRPLTGSMCWLIITMPNGATTSGYLSIGGSGVIVNTGTQANASEQANTGIEETQT